MESDDIDHISKVKCIDCGKYINYDIAEKKDIIDYTDMIYLIKCYHCCNIDNNDDDDDFQIFKDDEGNNTQIKYKYISSGKMIIMKTIEPNYKKLGNWKKYKLHIK